MTLLDAVLFGFVGSLVTLKVFLLAAAAMLLVHVLTHHVRQRSFAAVPIAARHHALDKYA